MNSLLRIILGISCLVTPARGQETMSAAEQSSPFSQPKFVPDISLIVDCSYLHRSLPDEEFGGLRTPGFSAPDPHAVSHRGFNLNYAELSLFSIVDPYFDLFAVLHLTEDHLHLEEAYWSTRKFPAGDLPHLRPYRTTQALLEAHPATFVLQDVYNPDGHHTGLLSYAVRPHRFTRRASCAGAQSFSIEGHGGRVNRRTRQTPPITGEEEDQWIQQSPIE